MKMTLNDLTINPDGVDLEFLLDDWLWLSPEPLEPVLLTAMGDVFAQGFMSGKVYFVDAVGGKLNSVANDGDSFKALLQDASFVSSHMFPVKIAQLREVGKTLGPMEVYSHKKMLAAGGEDNVGNIEACDVDVHISFHGQVHRQIKDLPPGTPIGKLEFKWPE